ncbi:MAG TPA: hypothetical protein VFB38_25015 [Chthonomonadaceae bacterium]|nr:hypothetical protein [Chthonomonadaceae bacterium]
MLLQYAREVHTVGVSRADKNKAQRLFEELGMDPSALDLDEFGLVPASSEAIGRATASHPAKSRIMYIERKAGHRSRARHGSGASPTPGAAGHSIMAASRSAA